VLPLDAAAEAHSRLSADTGGCRLDKYGVIRP
jgi:hypothetical protein